MKNVIRLTESDLTRIVRRVINEQSTEVIKVKVFGKTDDQKKGYSRSCNIDAKNIKLSGNRVRFDYTIPGGVMCNIWNGIESISGVIPSTGGKASIGCGRINDPNILFNEKNMPGYSDRLISGYLSKEGYTKLSYLCDEYASVEDDDMEDDDMMDNNYA